MEKKYCMTVVLATGKGSRMDGKMVKQYMEAGGKSLTAYALEVFEASPVIDEIILMTDVGYMEYVRTEIAEVYGLKRVGAIEAGGGERRESVWRTLCILMEQEEEGRKPAARGRQDGYVFIHDGTRLFVTGGITEQAYKAICNYSTYAAGMPVRDTVELVNQERMIEPSPDCSMMWQAQTPQVFFVSLIVEAFARQIKADCTGIVNDTMMAEVQMRVKVQMVMGSHTNIKITTSEDLFMAEVLRSSVVQL